VSARFALDAMPGKQMAIDADLRAGAIDAESARVRRTDLERESQLYGAMDGAMRFVKGDAIAAIVIVIINLIGGMVIGVGQRGMSAGDAVHTYSLLSIGEGLVAQIPSLLVAVASGLLVTRVASTGDRELGSDLPMQLGPRALAAAALLLVGLGLVPGLPIAPFVLLGLLAAVFALLAARARPKPAIVLDEPGASRLALRVSGELHAQLAPRITELHTALAAKRASVKAAVAIPPLAIERDTSLAAAEVALAIDGTPVVWLTFEGDPIASIERLPLAQLAPELVDVDRVAALVERTAVRAPILVREVVPRVISLPVLTEVVRALAREQVPVDDLAGVLEAIAAVPVPQGGFTAREAPQLVDQLRGRLRRQITARWAPRGQLAVFTIDSMIEDAVRGAIDRRDGVAILALEPAIAADIVAAVRGKVGTGPGVILASGDIRRHLRTLLEPELPEVAILAAHELAPETNVRTAGRIEVS
jgi:type III secretion protein V